VKPNQRYIADLKEHRHMLAVVGSFCIYNTLVNGIAGFSTSDRNAKTKFRMCKVKDKVRCKSIADLVRCAAACCYYVVKISL
jgi:hypothetical protein